MYVRASDAAAIATIVRRLGLVAAPPPPEAIDADVLRVVTQAQVSVPAKAGARKVCVRVVDVFGFEAEVVTAVGVA